MDSGKGDREDQGSSSQRKRDGLGSNHTPMDLVARPSSSQQEALRPNPAFHGPFPENAESPCQLVSQLSRLLSHSTYDKGE